MKFQHIKAGDLRSKMEVREHGKVLEVLPDHKEDRIRVFFEGKIQGNRIEKNFGRDELLEAEVNE